MTQVTKAMGEVPRALPQIYYSIERHEKGGERDGQNAREGEGKREGREGKEVGSGVSRNRMKLGGVWEAQGKAIKQMNHGPE